MGTEWAVEWGSPLPPARLGASYPRSHEAAHARWVGDGGEDQGGQGGVQRLAVGRGGHASSRAGLALGPHPLAPPAWGLTLRWEQEEEGLKRGRGPGPLRGWRGVGTSPQVWVE